MKSFGKSFGVRLAIGAATILFGVYAAALAQKDRQNNTESWSSGMPSLGQPVNPIEGQTPEPSTEPQSLASLAAGAFGPPATDVTPPSENPIQLVGHTEAADGMQLPDSLNTPAADPPSVEPPSWTLPPESAAEEPVSAAAAPSMAFPTAGLGAPSEVTAETGGQPNATIIATPDIATAQNDPAESASPGFATPELTAEISPEMDLPEAQLQTAPEAPYYLEDDVQYFPAGTELSAEASTNATVTADAGPSNILRSDNAGANILRDGPAPAPQTVGGLAQQDPQFAQSAQAFDQSNGAAVAEATINQSPSMGFANPTESFPQIEPESSQTIVGGPIDTAPLSNVAGQTEQPTWNQQPQARIASLPNQPGSLGIAAIPSYPQAMEQPVDAMPINPDATFDAPGERRLEGVQTPSVIIQKRAPSEVKVGKPASFVIQVQNVGSVEALDVRVQDRVPAGMRLVDASPTPVQQGNLLVWQLGSMPAGDERTLTMQLVPEQEGELGSVARVSFEAAASVRTISTRPELRVSQTAPETVLIGQQLEIELEVSNPGSGEATGVVLQEDVPDGLEHPKGRQLDNSMGTLAPGEVRKQVLRLRAVAPGMIQNTIKLTGDDGLSAEHTVAVQVIAPELQVDLKGPARRYLERPATYQLDIVNSGTADATNVELAVQLDRGFTFVSTDYEGQYDPSRHAVFWSLAQLPAGQQGSVPLTLLPVEEGQQAIVIDARADLGATARTERTMSVEGFAELSFEITNPGGPIEVGAETVYQIRVNNSGSKADSNIRVQLQLPQGLELISADSEAGTDGRGLVAFQPRSNLNPGDEITYNLRLRGTADGTHIVKAVVVSDQSQVPVTKEESTVVYSDQ